MLQGMQVESRARGTIPGPFCVWSPMIAVAPEVLAALVRSYLDEPVSIPDAQLDALESGPVPSPAAAFTGESAGFPSPAAVEDAIDTIRTLSESGVSPAESVDLDRIFSMLSSVRG